MEKVNNVIEIINNMDLKDKLRLAICISKSKQSGLIYNTKENYDEFDTILKELDDVGLEFEKGALEAIVEKAMTANKEETA